MTSSLVLHHGADIRWMWLISLGALSLTRYLAPTPNPQERRASIPVMMLLMLKSLVHFPADLLRQLRQPMVDHAKPCSVCGHRLPAYAFECDGVCYLCDIPSNRTRASRPNERFELDKQDYTLMSQSMLIKLLAVLTPRAQAPRTDWDRHHASRHIASIQQVLHRRQAQLYSFMHEQEDPYYEEPEEHYPAHRSKPKPALSGEVVWGGLQLAVFVGLLIARLIGWNEWAWYWIISPFLVGPALFIAYLLLLVLSDVGGQIYRFFTSTKQP